MMMAILTTGCEPYAGNVPLTKSRTYEVDQRFKEIYNQAGGAEMLGPAISYTFSSGQVDYQYTVASLLMRSQGADDPSAGELAPLGLDLGVLEVAVPPPDDDFLHYVDGHVIDPAFFPYYERLGGNRLFGPPLTEPRYNPRKKRVEQYFQNLGFYRAEDQPESSVGLLSYGAWKCGTSCSEVPISSPESEVEPPSPVHPNFRKAVERLGLHFTGFALGPAYITEDGSNEQIFENMILAINPGSGNRVSLRPIPVTLGIPVEPPVEPSVDDGLFFYPLQDGFGHNVPQYFLDYLAIHGGLDASGPPITELVQISNGVMRQCFANLCLERHLYETIPMRIRPTPLGFLFWQVQNNAQSQDGTSEKLPNEQTSDIVTQLADDGVVLHVWKKIQVVRSGQQQEIGAIVLKDGVPVPDLPVEVYVSFPDVDLRINLPPTGEDGQSFYKLDPIDAPTGSPIDFRVCIYIQAGQATCASDSFSIYK